MAKSPTTAAKAETAPAVAADEVSAVTESTAPAAEDVSTEGPEAAAAPEAPAADDEVALAHAGFIAMTHPDNGSCDRYESDAAGNILVPVADVADMLDHGFIVVESAA